MRKLLCILCAFLMTFSNVYAATTPAQVKNLTLKKDNAKISLSWKKAKGAKSYRVYLKVGGGDWKAYKTQSGKSLTYTAKKNGTYQFRVKGVNGKKVSKKYSNTVKTTVNYYPYIKLDKTSVSTSDGKSFTINVSGESASKAKWTFSSTYLEANTDIGKSKTFKAKKSGNTSITVSDGTHSQTCSVAIAKSFYLATPSTVELDIHDASSSSTIKVKGVSATNIVWRYDSNYLEVEESDDSKSLTIFPLKKGTTSVKASNGQKTLTVTVNIKNSGMSLDSLDNYPNDNYMFEASIINPNNETMYNGGEAVVPIYIKTGAPQGDWETYIIPNSADVIENQILEDVNDDWKCIMPNRDIRRYYDISYPNNSTYLGSDFTNVNNGYLFSKKFGYGTSYTQLPENDAEVPAGSYKVIVIDWNGENGKVRAVSEPFTLASYPQHYAEWKNNLLTNSVGCIPNDSYYETLLYNETDTSNLISDVNSNPQLKRAFEIAYMLKTTHKYYLYKSKIDNFYDSIKTVQRPIIESRIKCAKISNMYNTILVSEGITAVAEDNGGHQWNKVTVNGKTYNIDCCPIAGWEKLDFASQVIYTTSVANGTHHDIYNLG